MPLLVVVGGACRYGYDPLAATDAGEHADAAADADAAELDAAPAADAAPPDAACDPGAPFVEDFSAMSPRWATFAGGGATAGLVAGRLRATPAFGGGAGAYAGFVTKGAYDLTGHEMSVEVPTMVSTAGHAQALAQWVDQTDSSLRAGFEQQFGLLIMFVNGSAGMTMASTPYNPSLHRFWRLRESLGTIFFDTSPDGATWSPGFDAPAVFAVTRVRVELSAGTFQAEFATGFAEFDNVGGTVPLGTACVSASSSR